MITHYLKYKKNPDRKTRFDLVAYSEPVYESESYKPLDKPFIYAGRNPHIKANSERKSELQICWNGKNLSSVYFIDVDKPELAYGDINNTNDLLIFILTYDIIEVFIMKDNKNTLPLVIDLLTDNMLSVEIEYFRNKAVIFYVESQSL